MRRARFGRSSQEGAPATFGGSAAPQSGRLEARHACYKSRKRHMAAPPRDAPSRRTAPVEFERARPMGARTPLFLREKVLPAEASGTDAFYRPITRRDRRLSAPKAPAAARYTASAVTKNAGFSGFRRTRGGRNAGYPQPPLARLCTVWRAIRSFFPARRRQRRSKARGNPRSLPWRANLALVRPPVVFERVPIGEPFAGLHRDDHFVGRVFPGRHFENVAVDVAEVH
jgi:hypothetical protein